MDSLPQGVWTALANLPFALVVVAIVWVLLTKTLPAMQGRFDENQKAFLASSEKEQDKLLAFCGKIISDEREACNARFSEMRTDHQNLVVEVQAGFRESRLSHKETRHLVGDLANAVNLRRLAERAQQAEAEAAKAERAEGRG